VSEPARHLADDFEAAARRHANRPAVVEPDGTMVTYADLERRSRAIAAFLAETGVARGDRVGIAAPKSADAVAVLLGSLRAGCAYVPVDCESPSARIRGIFTDAAVKVIAADAKTVDALGECAQAVVLLPPSDGERQGATPIEQIYARAPTFTPPARREDDLAYVLFTSGSTGVPKGVALTHGNATSFVDWCSETFQPVEGDAFASHAPFHFDLSVLDLFVALKHGASIHLVGEPIARSPKALAAFVADRNPTVWYSTPAALTMMLQAGALADVAAPRLRLVLFAGEVFPIKHLRALTRVWPHPTYFNLYGPTETNVCTFARIPLPIPEDRTEPYPIGQPCAHCDALVLNDRGEPVRDEEEGLLLIAGPGVFQGYWGRPDLDASAFRPIDGRRWYSTGDIVRRTPDGLLFVGRRDRMVKRRGYRIELGEIERALHAHPSVAAAAAVAVPDESGGVRIAAFVAPETDDRPSIFRLRQHCASSLPSYMLPDSFHVVDALPRTSTNKIDYASLAAKPRSDTG
jgi:amino acid adenylation domain-containing protein